jgi:urea transport system substrate-binding protein
VPNQQILPALRFLVGFQGKRRWFLVGSDYVFPHTANAVIRDEAKTHDATILGEEYLKLGTGEVAGVLALIEQANPDLIVNTINGDTNVAFFRALRGSGRKSARTPVLSFSLAATELIAIGPRNSVGDFVAASYFQTLETPANREFLTRFEARYGKDRPVSPPVQAAYAGVHLWAQAVRAAGTDDPRAVRAAMAGQSFEAPQGTLRIDPATHHAIQTARVGRVGDDGRVVEVFVSPKPVEPDPFPGPRSRADWDAFLNDLHTKWGGRWSAQ